MRAAGVLGFALQALLCASSISASVLLPRAEETCSDLSAQSNNGDRKVAIVIDSSGSMAASDPTDLRLVAGRILNDWLIANNEARGGKKADLVTVIDFASTASLDFPLGDPGMANSSFDQIGADGGTWIASGVSMAISQLTQGNTGNTESRSGIIVFTDGQVSRIIYVVLICALNVSLVCQVRHQEYEKRVSRIAKLTKLHRMEMYKAS